MSHEGRADPAPTKRSGHDEQSYERIAEEALVNDGIADNLPVCLCKPAPFFFDGLSNVALALRLLPQAINAKDG